MGTPASFRSTHGHLRSNPFWRAGRSFGGPSDAPDEAVEGEQDQRGTDVAGVDEPPVPQEADNGEDEHRGHGQNQGNGQQLPHHAQQYRVQLEYVEIEREERKYAAAARLNASKVLSVCVTPCIGTRLRTAAAPRPDPPCA